MSERRPRFLVIRRRALGDLLVSLPALRDLRAAHPDAEIELLVDRELDLAAFAWAPVDAVHIFPRGFLARLRVAGFLRSRGYDVVVDFHSTPQTAFLSWWTAAPVRVGLALAGRAWAYTHPVVRVGSASAPDEPPPYIGDALRSLVAATAPSGTVPRGVPGMRSRPRHDPPRVALAPGATWSAKAWPPRSYAVLTRSLLAHGAEVTVFWGPGEEALARGIVDAAPGARLAPPGSIEDLGARLEESDLLISGDSGARHLAHALGLPTVAVFGPTDPWTQTPRHGWHRFLRYPIACAPCQRATCPLSQNHCLTRVLPEDVFREAAALLAGEIA